ncbi:transcriptional regulator, HxlR family [Catenulispora acidiphila DSM 44928]|uniref:Transcriptional regulator, HxlR family n=1 Tax=Catenulispora acidiphila (strain DSM 44928 / JCM 14897 / NBRC 102108 / NRRL B-24433 / ID139908) TaxID=479433 RepID=C7Q9B0_CATAD|nr:winged helix-turn-helix transcriptional regulator [Catenulispora acidiphila]ACU74256.1 transcriptional regulator, HxlR family [Catenulispora acidiphila DSM 44928]
MKYTRIGDTDCSIAQALDVVGDWWTLLVVRDVAGGVTRFSELAAELGVSRKVLTERLAMLVDRGVLERRQYSDRPARFEYHLTDAGRGLLPVLIALQNWGAQHVMGDGTLTATSEPASAEARRVHALVGTGLPALTLPDADRAPTDPVSAGAKWTVLYTFPGSPAVDPGLAPGWSDVPGGPGCTLEARTFRDRLPEFAAADAAVVGVCTQRPEQLARFAELESLPFPLLSDQALQLAAALRLPTFRAAGADRLKRATLIVDAARTIRGVLYPVPDPAASVDEALRIVAGL